MQRRFLSECYGSDKGQILLRQEADFLQRSITVSCKQTILQLGQLGWENKFIDSSLYQRFVVIDPELPQRNQAYSMVASELSLLPILSYSIDMIIMPHSLQFEHDQHQAIREIERVLKPEGKLIIINFNPWNYWVRYQYLLVYGKQDPLMRNFIRRSKIIDWLKLLNFEVDIVAGFRCSTSRQLKQRYKMSPTVVSYAVKAIKRRYNVIPLAPGRVGSFKFAVAGAVDSSKRIKKHD